VRFELVDCLGVAVGDLPFSGDPQLPQGTDRTEQCQEAHEALQKDGALIVTGFGQTVWGAGVVGVDQLHGHDVDEDSTQSDNKREQQQRPHGRPVATQPPANGSEQIGQPTTHDLYPQVTIGRSSRI
jgi:hypothetical protein